MRRSLHVFGALSRGGAETWFLQALARRGSSGWSADVCLLAGQEGACVPAARELGVRVVHCPYKPAATFPTRLLRLLRREQYDSVHAHVLLFSGVIAAVAGRAGVRLRVAHAHNAHDGRPDSAGRALYRTLMRRLIADQANLVLACSRQAAEAFSAPGTRILPYGIDLSAFALGRRRRKAELGVPEGAPLLGMVGRLIAQKNHAFLFGAFAEALRRAPELHLAVIGEGELRGELERRALELGLANRVQMLGLREDVPALLQGLCDGFVMPSLHEGLPLALLEAQAAGLPCLIADTISAEAVALPEQVERLPLDGATWAAGLERVGRRPRQDSRLAVERLRAAGFDAADSWARLTSLYDEALGAERKAQAA